MIAPARTAPIPGSVSSSDWLAVLMLISGSAPAPATAVPPIAGTTIWSSSRAFRERLIAVRSASSVAPPAAATASTQRDPASSGYTPGASTAPTTYTRISVESSPGSITSGCGPSSSPSSSTPTPTSIGTANSATIYHRQRSRTSVKVHPRCHSLSSARDYPANPLNPSSAAISCPADLRATRRRLGCVSPRPWRAPWRCAAPRPLSPQALRAPQWSAALSAADSRSRCR